MQYVYIVENYVYTISIGREFSIYNIHEQLSVYDISMENKADTPYMENWVHITLVCMENVMHITLA